MVDDTRMSVRYIATVERRDCPAKSPPNQRSGPILHMSNEPLKHSQTLDFYIRFIFWLDIILSFQYQVIDYINVHLSRIRHTMTNKQRVLMHRHQG